MMMMMTLLLEILREADPDLQRSVCVLDALLLLTININERRVWIYLCLSKKTEPLKLQLLSRESFGSLDRDDAVSHTASLEESGT